MSRVIIFSRTFPKYHPKAGEPTYFVEKFINSIDPTYLEHGKKYHTIRAGHRWRVGDKFSPRAWSGLPYRSKQIIIAPDIEIKKIWDIHFHMKGSINLRIKGHSHHEPSDVLKQIANNDGLSYTDFIAWFSNAWDLDGQIICWNENINYL